MHTTLRLIPLGLVLVVAPAFAQITNGDFSANLTGWNTLGDVGNRDAAAYLTTAAASGIDDATSFNYSGVDPVFASSIEDTFSFPAGSLDPDAATGLSAQEGSLLFRTITVQAGDVLSFSYTFLSNDASTDFAFVLFDTLTSDLTSALTRTATTDYGFSLTTGTQTFTSAPATETRTVALAVGVLDSLDTGGTSALVIDNVVVTSAIPEPASFATLAGLAGLGLAAYRRRRA